MAQLIISLNNQIIKRIKLTLPSYLIGRSTQCDILLAERTVSSQHARLINAGEDCFLEDMDSTNGVYANSQRIQKHLLMDADVITIGKFQLVYRSSAGLLTQLRQLSVHPRLLENSELPQLRIMNGRKQGHIIPIQRDRLRLGENGIGQIMVEKNQAGDYLLHQLGESTVKTVVKLQHGDSFEIGDIELQFHQTPKTATL